MTLAIVITIGGLGIYLTAKHYWYGNGYREALEDAGYLVALADREQQGEAAEKAAWN